MSCKPLIYLAGKIHRNDWRHKLVPQLRSHSADDTPLELPDWVMTGPFFKSCDHGCHHGSGSHGVRKLGGRLCPPGDDADEREIIENCKAAIRFSDIVIAYIESPDCFGTLIELGYAHALKKEIYVFFSNKFDETIYEDFWMSRQLGTYDCFVCEGALAQELKRIIRMFRRKKGCSGGRNG